MGYDFNMGMVVAIVNIALAAAGMKKRVGILDADIFGPSIPSLMNLRGEPDITEKGNKEERDRMDPYAEDAFLCKKQEIALSHWPIMVSSACRWDF